MKEVMYCPNCKSKMKSEKAVNWQLYKCSLCEIEISVSIFLDLPKIVKWMGKEIEEGNEKTFE